MFLRNVPFISEWETDSFADRRLISRDGSESHPYLDRRTGTRFVIAASAERTAQRAVPANAKRR
jgi:hypothetical protein